MSHETKFLYIAIRQSDCPDRARGAADLAEIHTMGGVTATSREEFIRGGIEFIKSYPGDAKERIEDLCQDPDFDQEVVREIRVLIQESKEVLLGEFEAALATYWDEEIAERADAPA